MILHLITDVLGWDPSIKINFENKKTDRNNRGLISKWKLSVGINIRYFGRYDFYLFNVHQNCFKNQNLCKGLKRAQATL